VAGARAGHGAAIVLANDTIYGLGANLWTRDLERRAAARLTHRSRSVFINGMVASDPRLPFAREAERLWARLSDFGIHEFVTSRRSWMNDGDEHVPAAGAGVE